MTSSGISHQGEGSGAGALCQRPQQAQRWVQTLLYPPSCYSVRVDCHTAPGNGAWCFSLEVKDAHDRELLGLVVEPARPAATDAQRISYLLESLRVVLLELTDPDPF